MPIRWVLFVALALAACARQDRRDVNDPGSAHGPGIDAFLSSDDDGGSGENGGNDGGSDGGIVTLPDLAVAGDAFGPSVDAGGSADLAHVTSGSDGGTLGIISGGPCASGAAGATAYRVAWAGTGPGSVAYPMYEVNGLPDHSRDHAGAYTYQIGGSAVWDDPYLGAGGLVLDDSDFVDLELSTSGISHITSATIAILGRSFATTTDGSFSWQTANGTGATAANAVSNVAPYVWYRADATSEIDAGNAGLLLRIKAGPSSDSLIVNRIELCLVAD